jgi:K+-sensing histidine kinase KdpD
LEAVSFAARCFLAAADWEQHIVEVLERLGVAAEASRVYLFENHTDAQGDLLTTLRYEWVAPGVASRLGDPVLHGFAGNAVAYTPRGGRVNIGVTCTGDERKQVCVAVYNDGPPIPPEDLQHLFERFYRGQIGQASGEAGTGLGLAICKEIVERHGGHLRIRSEPPHGTVFEIWLPLRAGY